MHGEGMFIDKEGKKWDGKFETFRKIINFRRIC